jgi:hypothetical protein
MGQFLVERKALRRVAAALVRFARAECGGEELALDRLFHVIECLVDDGLDDRLALSIMRSASGAAGLNCDRLLKRVRRKRALHREAAATEEISAEPDNVERTVSEEAQTARRRHLASDAVARNWIGAKGIDSETAEAYGFGLERPRRDRIGSAANFAITVPVRRSDGTAASKLVKLARAIGSDQIRERWWTAGAPQSFFSLGGALASVVCIVDLPDLFALATAYRVDELDSPTKFLSSTVQDAIPREWTEEAFWRRWKFVIIGSGAPIPRQTLVLAAARSAGCKTFVPGADTCWREVVRLGGSAHDFHAEVICPITEPYKVKKTRRQRSVALVSSRPGGKGESFVPAVADRGAFQHTDRQRQTLVVEHIQAPICVP